MTLRVNRDIGFQVASTHEFPEGGAAVSLDGGSHFYEQDFVKIAFAANGGGPNPTLTAAAVVWSMRLLLGAAFREVP
jgi:hypothetical protein